MQFMLKPAEADLKDSPPRAPDIVPAEWADRVLADIIREVKSGGSNFPPRAEPAAAAPPSEPRPLPTPPQGSGSPSIPVPDTASLDTAFRGTDMHAMAGNAPPAGRWGKRILIGFALALCGAAAAWPHYGDVARQTIANWTPELVATSAAPADAAASDQPSPSDTPASASASTTVPPATTTEAAVPLPSPPAGTPPSLPPEAVQALQSMARDMASMAQQVEQLKAGMAELKTGLAKVSDVKASDIKAADKAAEVRTSALTPRSRPPKLPPPALRTATPPSFAATARQPRPLTAGSYVPPPPPLPPTAAVSPPLPTPITAQPDDEPVTRPPMPVR